MKNKIIALLLAAIMTVSFTGCRESDVVSYNIWRAYTEGSKNELD